MSIETQPFDFLDAIQHWAQAVSAFLVLVVIAILATLGQMCKGA